MDHAVLVRVRQCIGGLDAVATEVVQGHCAGVELIAQRSAVHILHGDERSAADVADFVDRADMWMVQGGGIPCLTQHTGSRRFVVAPAVHELQGDVPMEGRVEGEEHDSHPSAPEHALDAVGAEHLAGLRETGRLWRVQTPDSMQFVWRKAKEPAAVPGSEFQVPGSCSEFGFNVHGSWFMVRGSWFDDEFRPRNIQVKSQERPRTGPRTPEPGTWNLELEL